MGYVYRYTDTNDGIIKYVGIVWSENRTLRQRIREHSIYDDWCQDKQWKIEYLFEDINTRTDAEYMEAHYISLYQTDQYYNIKKAGWGISSFIPHRDNWQLFDSKKDSVLEKIENELSSVKNENNILNEQIKSLQHYISYLEENIRSKETKVSENTLTNNKLEKVDVSHKYEYNGETLYCNQINKKNKSKNDLTKVVINSKNYFARRKRKGGSHSAIPCKLILYVQGVKKEWRYFDSIRECSDFCGLSQQHILNSMLNKNNSTYFEYNDCGTYGYYSGVLDSTLEWCPKTKTILLRVCAITPLTEMGKEYFSNKDSMWNW